MNRKLNLLLAVIIILAAAGIWYYNIEPDYDQMVTKHVKVQVEITRIDPPLFYDIDFKSLDGTLKGRLESRKCDEWKNVRVGTIYELEFYQVTKYDDGKVVSIENNYPSACTFANYAKPVYYPEVKY